MTTISEKIHKEIEDRNLNITAFAKKIGVSRDTIYNLSDETIKYATIKKIAAVLQLPISHFINDEDKKMAKNGKSRVKPDVLGELTQKHRKLLNEINSVASEIDKEIKKLKKTRK